MSAGSPEGVSSHGVPRDGAGASSRVAVQVDVKVPEGSPGPRVTVIFEPDTAEEFEAAVEALGGPEGFGVMTGLAFKRLDERTVAHVHQPSSERHGSVVRLDPFMDRFLSKVQAATKAAA